MPQSHLNESKFKWLSDYWYFRLSTYFIVCNVGKSRLIANDWDTQTLTFRVAIGKVQGEERSSLMDLHRHPSFITNINHSRAFPWISSPAKKSWAFSSLQAAWWRCPSIIPIRFSILCQTAPFPPVRCNCFLYQQQSEARQTLTIFYPQVPYRALSQASKHSRQLFKQDTGKAEELSREYKAKRVVHWSRLLRWVVSLLGKITWKEVLFLFTCFLQGCP